jgi:hypothetical protein
VWHQCGMNVARVWHERGMSVAFKTYNDLISKSTSCTYICMYVDILDFPMDNVISLYKCIFEDKRCYKEQKKNFPFLENVKFRLHKVP